MSSNDKVLNPPLIWIAAIGALALLAIIGLYLYIFGVPTISRESAGLFGDFFGGALNPLLSFLALIALLYTIHLQIRELKLTRLEFERSVATLKDQGESMKIQRFENTFFNLLSIYHDTVNNMTVASDEEEFKGRKSFHVLCSEWENNGLARILRGDHHTPSQGLIIEYKEFYEKHEHLISHYFRTIYNILTFLKDEKDEGMGKHVKMEKYTKLFRAQISPYEMEILFFDSRHPDIGGSLKQLMDEFGVLKYWNGQKEIRDLLDA